jgi:WD40 repeat protein
LTPVDAHASKDSVPVLSRPIAESLEASNPTPRAKSYCPLLSSDGKVAAVGALSGGGRLNTFQAWDAQTGAAMGPAIATPALGAFTAAALSGDGRFLALAENARALEAGEPVPLNPSGVGRVCVWDLRAGKLKWQLPAINYEGDPTTSDDNVWSLSFSPDAMRLAVSCRSPNGCRLKILRLEDGVASPQIERPDRRAGTPAHGQVYWGAQGRQLLFRDGLDFEIWDSVELTRKQDFTLALASRPRGARDAAADHAPNAADAGASAFHNSASVLNATATHLAILRQRLTPEKKLRQLRVVVFDVASRKPIGFTALPDERYQPGGVIRAEPIGNVGVRVLASADTVRGRQLALSGNANRLAISDDEGIVNVYEMAQLIENARHSSARRNDGNQGRLVNPPE